MLNFLEKILLGLALLIVLIKEKNKLIKDWLSGIYNRIHSFFRGIN